MATQNGQPIQYFLNLSHDLINMNQLIGKKVKLKHIGYECVSCGSDEKILIGNTSCIVWYEVITSISGNKFM